MRRIPLVLWDRIAQHCLETVPEEAVGYLAARRGDEHLITDVVPVPNVAEDAHARYEVDEREQLAVWEALDRQDKRVVATYHSHVGAPAVLSDLDVDLARDPNMLHMVVSIYPELHFPGGLHDVALYRVRYLDGVPTVTPRLPWQTDDGITHH